MRSLRDLDEESATYSKVNIYFNIILKLHFTFFIIVV